MMVEVIVQNQIEAVQAEKWGADRLELVSAISEGGLTPSYGTIKQVLRSVSIPVQVMIRPHSKGFWYDENDFAIIQDDIKAVLDLGGKGIVFGALLENGTIDEYRLKEVIATAPEMDITFHRAFDEIPDQKAAYTKLARYSDHIKRILTSGGEPDAQAGKENLRELVKLAKNIEGPGILPGGGLSRYNIKSIHQAIGAKQYHFGKAVRVNNLFTNTFDPEKMNSISNALI
ncbi:copper homeostasis protein [Virgibacillus natechei]|uniref:PF03932 family protein CutC n=1 Tax=Virgibacillus natechei TaxID=1216297 RepID=A0ABS4IH84_9BACI|nr:copper homeostasis protein CutC [Virgibacillus natechei]MBP1970322.1 copper homeostasis protein [Virgibacillus natechei]UZD13149.1 copper homeostasis protein CutC [Virgibacillus natechei]